MSATDDVRAFFRDMRPAPGQTVEDFAKDGLLWQTEIYSANAGFDIQGLQWHEITEQDRDSWREWARKKGAVDPHSPTDHPTPGKREPHPQ
jgi:hypothetical protein